MPTINQLVDGSIPTANDFNSNFTALNNAIGASTAIASFTTGDTLYASAANTLSRLPIGTPGQVYGVVAGVPAWTATASGMGGTRGLKISPHDPAQGTWVNGTTMYAAVASPT